MKKVWKWVIAIVILIIIFLMLYKPKENYFDRIELSKDNAIINRTEIKFLDTILKVGLDELGLKTIIISVRNITIKSDVPDLDLRAHILVSRESPNVYLLEIKKDHRSTVIKNLSHELIHLQQFNSGELRFGKDYLIWKGDTLHKQNIPNYEDREWELDAVSKGKLLEVRIKNRLYQLQ